MKFLNWLNGKKTIIGLFIIALAGQQFFQNWINNADIIAALMWVGGVLSGTGLVHKAIKGRHKQ